MKYSGIGGQAVIEGIMMKNGDDYATAVRKPDGEIEVARGRYVSLTEKVKFFSLPFVRGVFSFADSMIIGMKTLTWSAGFFEDDESTEPGKFELWLDRVFGEKLEAALMSLVMVISHAFVPGASPADPVRDRDGHSGRHSQNSDLYLLYQADLPDGGHPEDLYVSWSRA